MLLLCYESLRQQIKSFNYQVEYFPGMFPPSINPAQETNLTFSAFVYASQIPFLQRKDCLYINNLLSIK